MPSTLTDLPFGFPDLPTALYAVVRANYTQEELKKMTKASFHA